MKAKQLMHRVSENEHRELKAFCAAHGITIQEFMTKAVDEYRKKWVV